MRQRRIGEIALSVVRNQLLSRSIRLNSINEKIDALSAELDLDRNVLVVFMMMQFKSIGKTIGFSIGADGELSLEEQQEIAVKIVLHGIEKESINLSSMDYLRIAKENNVTIEEFKRFFSIMFNEVLVKQLQPSFD